MEWVCLWKAVPVGLYTVKFTFAGNPLPQPPSQFLMSVSSDEMQLSDWQLAHGMMPALSRCFFPYSNWWTTWQPVTVFDGQLERHFPQVTYITLLEKLLSCIISFTKCWLLQDVWVLLVLVHCWTEFPSFISVAAQQSTEPLVYCLIIQNKWRPN